MLLPQVVEDTENTYYSDFMDHLKHIRYSGKEGRVRGRSMRLRGKWGTWTFTPLPWEPCAPVCPRIFRERNLGKPLHRGMKAGVTPNSI